MTGVVPCDEEPSMVLVSSCSLSYTGRTPCLVRHMTQSVLCLSPRIRRFSKGWCPWLTQLSFQGISGSMDNSLHLQVDLVLLQTLRIWLFPLKLKHHRRYMLLANWPMNWLVSKFHHRPGSHLPCQVAQQLVQNAIHSC